MVIAFTEETKGELCVASLNYRLLEKRPELSGRVYSAGRIENSGFLHTVFLFLLEISMDYHYI